MHVFRGCFVRFRFYLNVVIINILLHDVIYQWRVFHDDGDLWWLVDLVTDVFGQQMQYEGKTTKQKYYGNGQDQAKYGKAASEKKYVCFLK